jgi:hypothetical protein
VTFANSSTERRASTITSSRLWYFVVTSYLPSFVFLKHPWQNFNEWQFNRDFRVEFCTGTCLTLGLGSSERWNCSTNCGLSTLYHTKEDSALGLPDLAMPSSGSVGFPVGHRNRARVAETAPACRGWSCAWCSVLLGKRKRGQLDISNTAEMACSLGLGRSYFGRSPRLDGAGREPAWRATNERHGTPCSTPLASLIRPGPRLPHPLSDPAPDPVLAHFPFPRGGKPARRCWDARRSRSRSAALSWVPSPLSLARLVRVCVCVGSAGHRAQTRRSWIFTLDSVDNRRNSSGTVFAVCQHRRIQFAALLHQPHDAVRTAPNRRGTPYEVRTFAFQGLARRIVCVPSNLLRQKPRST